jgi:ABC-2 type transport system permease protein
MKSRTSFFNAAVFRKDILRFAPVWVLYLIGSLLLGPENVASSAGFSGSARELISSVSSMTLVNFLYAILTAQLLFGDLFNSRLSNALHALPIRREGWFLTHTLSGILFSLAPNLVLSLIYLCYLEQLWYVSFLWLLAVTLQYLFFFGVAAVSAMCTGNRFAMATVYGLINFFSEVVLWFVMTFYAPLLYGLQIREADFSRFCPAIEMSQFDDLLIFRREVTERPVNGILVTYIPEHISQDWWYLAIVAGIGLVLLGLALLLYRKRNLETAGDFAAFPKMKPVICVILTLTSGAILATMGELFSSSAYFFLAVGIVIGYFVSQMLLQRTLRVFHWKQFLGCTAIGGALALTIFLTALDPLGITRWTPRPQDVESVTITDLYYYDVASSSGPNYSSSDSIRRTIILEDTQAIEDVVRAHNLILTGRRSPAGNTGAIHLTYTLKDGRQITRRYYYLHGTEAGKLLDQIFSRPEFILGYEDWEEYLSQIKTVTVDGTVYTSTEANELLEAIRADCEKGTMFQSRSSDLVHAYVDIEAKDGSTKWIAVYIDCTHTRQWLKDHN